MKEQLFERLLNVFGRWSGRGASLLLGEKLVDKKVYEIEQVSQAIAAAQHLPVELSYEGGEVSVRSNPSASAESLMAYRVLTRLAHQETKRQIAAEDIAATSAKLLGEGEAPEEEPTDTWIDAFFASASMVSEVEVRNLWARVLAGEVRVPGSVSLRTLDVLRTIDQQTALAFEEIRPFIVSVVGGADSGASVNPFLTNSHLREGGIWNALTSCVDAALVRAEDEALFFAASNDRSKHVFRLGSIGILITRAAPAPRRTVNIRSLTHAGRELFALTEPLHEREIASEAGDYLSGDQDEVTYGGAWQQDGQWKTAFVTSVTSVADDPASE